MTTLVKLGGSAITDKDRAETLDGASLDSAVDAIANALERGDLEELIVVHGGGSFGHVHASEHGVTTTDGSTDVAAVHDIHTAMKTLNGFVLSRLLERGVPAVPIHPFSCATRGVDGRLTLETSPIDTLVSEGFVPVLHGDVVAHERKGVTILSGDELITELATSIETERIGLCSTVPGVLDESDAVIDRIERYEDVAHVLGASESTDVTGGMAEKVRALLELDGSAEIFAVEGLSAFLAGVNPGTTICGSSLE